MAVYTLGNISIQMKFWKMISMQFVQVRSQNRSVPSRGGRYGKNISIFHDFITILCHVSFTTVACKSLGTPCRICENVNSFNKIREIIKKCMLFLI